VGKDAGIEPQDCCNCWINVRHSNRLAGSHILSFLRLHLCEINVKRLWFASFLLSLGEISVRELYLCYNPLKNSLENWKLHIQKHIIFAPGIHGKSQGRGWCVQCNVWVMMHQTRLSSCHYVFQFQVHSHGVNTTSTNTLVCIKNIILSITHSLEIKWKMPTKSRKNDSPEQLSRVVDVLLIIFLNKKNEWANLRMRWWHLIISVAHFTSVVDPDPPHFGKLDPHPDPHQLKIRIRVLILIRI
jgi:hypothetical protein